MTGCARRPDASTVLVDDAAADRQAQARAAQRSCVRSVALLEAVEDVLQLLFGNSATLVTNFEQRFLIVEVACRKVNLSALWRAAGA